MMHPGSARGSNPRGTSPEQDWLSEAQKKLGENFAEKILRFGWMSLEEFKDFNRQIKEQFVQGGLQEVGSSRLRKVYEIIQGAQDLNDLILALPRLAYMVGKEDKERVKNQLGILYKVFEESIKGARTRENLQGIRKFAEALVAYHKFYAKDSNR